MNRWTIPTWYLFAHIILVPGLIVLQIKILNDIVMTILIIMCILFIPYFIYLLPRIGCPKDMFDIEFSKYSFQTDIVCNQLSSSKYEIIIRKNKTEILDMKGWIFKKTHIKDITLLHYHLDYYNKKQLKSFKCNSKKFFPDKTISIIFKMKNGKEKKMYMIKNGREKRSFLLDLKIFIISGLRKRGEKLKKDYHHPFMVIAFYRDWII